MDVMLRCMKMKKRYITLVKRCRYSLEASSAASSSGMGASSSVVPFTAQDESELRRIEESIPIQALLMFRQFAAHEMITEAKREERELLKEGRGKNIMASLGWTSNAHSSSSSSNSGDSNSGSNISGSSSSGLVAGREKGFGKSSLSSSSVSSWFKFNLKKSMKNGKKESDVTSGAQIENQKYTKKKEKVIEVDEEDRDEDDDDDEKIIAIIQSQLELEPIGTDHFIFRLVLNSSAALRLTTEGNPVALLEVALSSTTEMKTDGILIQFALDDFQLIDECSVNPLSKYLIVSAECIPQPASSHLRHPPAESPAPVPAPKGPVNPFSQSLTSPPKSPPRQSRRKKQVTSDSTAPKLLLAIDSRHGKTVVKLTARPMEATWNELCVGRLLGIFMAPDITHSPVAGSLTVPSSSFSSSPSSSSFSPMLTASMNKFAMDASLPIAGEMELIVEIDAPKIIIPDDCCRDRGCLLADMGYLVIRGTSTYVKCFFCLHLYLYSYLRHFPVDSSFP